MKKALCILLAALFLFSAMTVNVTAKEETPVSAAAVTRDITGVQMEKGDVVTIHYQNLDERCNKPLPKGGHIEWYWGYYGGKASFSLSADQKNCTVRATQAGSFALGCEVYDAKGNKISDDALIFEVSSPFYRFINMITLGIYGSIRYLFWDLMRKLYLLPLYDIT